MPRPSLAFLRRRLPLLLLLLVAAYAFLVEPNRLAVSRHAVGAGEAPAVRLLQLTDLHLHSIGYRERRVAAIVAAARPALLAITGDAVDRPDALPLLERFLASLSGAEGGRFAILGNWEYWSGLDRTALRGLYARYGFRLLVNEAVGVVVAGRPVTVVGLDDQLAGSPDLRLLLSTRGAASRLVLLHEPALIDRTLVGPAAAGWGDGRTALLLAGHTHGGQVAIPWLETLPPGSGRYSAGWYRGRGWAMYVSRGIGTSLLPARLGARPEVALFEWRP